MLTPANCISQPHGAICSFTSTACSLPLLPPSLVFACTELLFILQVPRFASLLPKSFTFDLPMTSSALLMCSGASLHLVQLTLEQQGFEVQVSTFRWIFFPNTVSPSYSQLLHLWTQATKNGKKQYCHIFIHRFPPPDWKYYLPSSVGWICSCEGLFVAKFCRVKGYMQIFNCWELGSSGLNSSVVQWWTVLLHSTVLHFILLSHCTVSLREGIFFFWVK